jgi:hypothetical protein
MLYPRQVSGFFSAPQEDLIKIFFNFHKICHFLCFVAETLPYPDTEDYAAYFELSGHFSGPLEMNRLPPLRIGNHIQTSRFNLWGPGDWLKNNQPKQAQFILFYYPITHLEPGKRDTSRR